MLTVLAALFVIFELILPTRLEYVVRWDSYVRLPAEALAGLAIAAMLSGRWRTWFAVSGGVLLGLLTVVKVFDLGFYEVLSRPFDLVLDWPLLGPGLDYVRVTAGQAGAIGAVAGAVALGLLLIALTTMSALQLSRAAARHRGAATHTAALLTVLAVVFALPGMRPTGGPVTSFDATDFAYAHAKQVAEGFGDHERFLAEASVDAYRGVPATDLLGALRGKDVLFTFVESYGRSALEHPEMSGRIGNMLDEGTQQLQAAGYSARSGFLTSTTFGGGSWLAQASVQSGLKIDNQQRYRNLVASDRLTLSKAFGKAGWDAIGVMPGITTVWPEGPQLGYQKIRTAPALDYHGPRFGYATMPDQFTMARFQQLERTPGHKPLMAMIPLLSSHSPWNPVPKMLDWDQVGDGSIYTSMPSGAKEFNTYLSQPPSVTRADYAGSVEYTVRMLVSYIERYGDPNLVVVMLGDHQPAETVTDRVGGRDAPISVISKDQAVMDRIAGWKWDSGLRPSSTAPVWPMQAFRDQFLGAFSGADVVAAQH
ncbi:sulfatase [Pseudonocardiaceae bacterium YIM PH 21723]|nr:sulfatase [Pseudonocardiaceae bacterium YIM PH 21723]